MIELFRVIDWMLRLPKEKEMQFRENMLKVEEEATMRYVSSIERLAMDEGMEKGMQQGMLQGMHQGQVRALTRILAIRFGELPDWVQQELAKATDSTLDTWIDAAFGAKSLEEVFAAHSRH